MSHRSSHEHLFQLGHRHLLALQCSSCSEELGKCRHDQEPYRFHLVAIGITDDNQAQQLLCW